ncbi:hypothetical protein L596_017918 [Steinernema carpocapsae]|uniref:Uncharacterized protein n=1 Tax=Steinernema carpocapsae TaxID=34508 RepID=A0A4U5N3H0_STECR|nr:hypothetical protein L596_017918 [Steinernema carpocapsae]
MKFDAKEDEFAKSRFPAVSVNHSTDEEYLYKWKKASLHRLQILDDHLALRFLFPFDDVNQCYMGDAYVSIHQAAILKDGQDVYVTVKDLYTIKPNDYEKRSFVKSVHFDLKDVQKQIQNDSMKFDPLSFGNGSFEITSLPSETNRTMSLRVDVNQGDGLFTVLGIIASGIRQNSSACPPFKVFVSGGYAYKKFSIENPEDIEESPREAYFRLFNYYMKIAVMPLLICLMFLGFSALLIHGVCSLVSREAVVKLNLAITPPKKACYKLQNVEKTQETQDVTKKKKKTSSGGSQDTTVDKTMSSTFDVTQDVQSKKNSAAEGSNKESSSKTKDSKKSDKTEKTTKSDKMSE